MSKTTISLPSLLSNLRLPVAAALFIISDPGFATAQCKARIVRSFPSINARPEAQLHEWLARMTEAPAAHDAAFPGRPAAPFAVNQIVHHSNRRLERDIALCVTYTVPIVISSLGAMPEVNEAVHSYGGLVLHDVIHDRHARSAIAKGADGLIAVAAGGGEHTGALSPFALVQEIRNWFDGPLLLSGAIARGSTAPAAQAMGAELAHIGFAFSAPYKRIIVESHPADIVATAHLTGVTGNDLHPSIAPVGPDADHIAEADAAGMDLQVTVGTGSRAWRDIWGADQGIRAITAIPPVAGLADRLATEYAAAHNRLAP